MGTETHARSNVRDTVVTALFGLGAPWAWAFLLGVSGIAEGPVLAVLSHVMPLSRASMPLLLTGYSVVAALLCAVVIALPLGYLVRRRPGWVWLQFALLFWLALALGARLGPEPVDLSVFYAHPDAWLFLGASALWIVLGRKLGQRRATT